MIVLDASQNTMLMIFICLIFLVCLLLAKPLKHFLKLTIRGSVGLFAVYVLNTLLSGLNILVGMNFLTWLITGVLGIPGLVLLYSLSLVL